MISDYNIDIDLKQKRTYQQILKFNQYDRGVYVKVSLFDDGEPYTIPSTETPIIELSLPKGTGYIISGSSIKDIVDNTFRFAIDRNISLNSGDAFFNVALVDKETGTTTRKGSFKNSIKIISNSIDEGTVSESLAVSIIETIQSNVATATAKETSLRDAITDGDLDNYVTKVAGKGLSTNDFTNAYKTILDGLTTTINNAVLEGKKSLYPVNSIYLSLNSTNPSEILGFGTWVQVAQGRSLVGVDTTDADFEYASKVGGSKTHNHEAGTLVADIGAVDSNLGSIGYNATGTTKNNYNRGVSASAIGDIDSKKANHATTVSGNTANSSSLQPYYCVYIFKRTA